MQYNIPLNDKNWFRTGGLAKFYDTPATHEEFAQSLKFAKEHSLPIFILGEGANILISDDGFSGLVIRPSLSEITINGEYVKAGAGVSMQHLIDTCLENKLIGLEEFSGIPGSVGGSVFINIHYFEHLLSDYLVSANIINKETGEVINVSSTWFNFGYNQSNLHNHEYFLLDATFKLKPVPSSEYSRGRRDEIVRHRARRYPSFGTCGSFFRNFTKSETSGSPIYIAYYLDKIGVKGNLSVGGASVSYQHANMIVNNGSATSSDIINLARKMQELVYKEFKLTPVPECRFIGFSGNPLHTHFNKQSDISLTAI